MSKVAFSKIKDKSHNGLFKAVWRAMELANWKRYVKGKKIFLKINGISDQVVPGQCTNPWVIEAVIQKLQNEIKGVEISMGDADLAASEQLDDAAYVWGFKRLAKKYGVKFVNLSKDKLIKRKIKGKIFKELHIPKTVLDADTVITMPVLKSHCLTHLTGALKNQWGVVPRVRHQYHLVVNQCIADINKFLSNITFVVMDATMCMEGNAPRTGIPKECNLIIASPDRVATDTAAAKYMDLPSEDNPMMMRAEEMGVGKRKHTLVGDKVKQDPFIKPKPGRQPIFLLEMNLRKVPIVKQLLFDTPVFKFCAWGATKYNTWWWYNKKGKKYAREVCENSWMSKIYKPLCRRAGLKV
jgi:uncharacterized protein (DUF362 family)